MFKVKRGAGRPPDKRSLIVSDIRGRIVSGELGPEARLPSQAVLEKRFKASSPTVQQALNVLTRDGFIEAFGRRGTFVKKYPPHLNHYALLSPFGATGVQHQTSNFYEILAHQALYIQRLEPQRRITVYHGINGHLDEPDFQTVIQKITDQCLAGLIFMFPPKNNEVVAESPIVTQTALPRVQVSTDGRDADMPSLYPDSRSFFSRAVEHLAARNCRRIAMLSITGVHSLDTQFHEALGQHGLSSPAYLNHFIEINSAKAANHVVQLLMQLPADKRPEGIIISDDHLVPGASAGLAALNLPSDQLPLTIGLANFPRPPSSTTPIIRLGFDCKRLLRLCVDYIDTLRKGEKVPAMTWLPAIFETELR